MITLRTNKIGLVWRCKLMFVCAENRIVVSIGLIFLLLSTIIEWLCGRYMHWNCIYVWSLWEGGGGMIKGWYDIE